MRLPDWLQKRRWLLIPIGVVFGIGLAVASHYVPWPEGFGLKGKTLWDWLSLLGVPLSLALLGVWFQQREKQRDADTAKEEALQVYFDRISTLLVEKNLRAIAAKVYGEEVEGSETQLQEPATDEQRELLDASMDVIRSRTLSILRRFNDDRTLKSSVILFLVEAEIINKLKLSLRGADLSASDLSGADLSSADLSSADLSFADLRDANLHVADLSDTNLRGANLHVADLSFANLSVADLGFADLSGTNLRGANLHAAMLSAANLCSADLRGANLSAAMLSATDLGSADLRGVNLSKADLFVAKFDGDTTWPELEKISTAKNIPVKLKKQLGILTDEG